MTEVRVLPAPNDPRWRSDVIAGGGVSVRYLPYAPPFASRPSPSLDWFLEDGGLVLLEDGYPAKLTDSGVLVHPMHGRYVLEDLIRRHDADASAALRAEIQRIARAIIGRSESRGDARRFWYEGAARSALAATDRHLSGLPQAYYARLLTRAGGITHDRSLVEAADGFFKVLTVPVAADGVRYAGQAGASLAMVPMQPRDWILNGWLSMLVAVAGYAAERPSPVAEELVRENLATLLGVLPAFDVPDLRLSRYMLAGVVSLAVDVDPPTGVAIRDLTVSVPGEGRYPIPRREAAGWRNWLRPHAVGEADAERYAHLTGSSARFAAVISRAPYPVPNAIEADMLAPREVAVRLRAHIGRYDPMGSQMVEREWVELARAHLPVGRTRVILPVPYEPVEMVSYPTNFARTYGGRRLNVYHATHIVRLRELAQRMSEPALASWADRWRAYVDEWPSIPAYRGLGAWSPEGDL